MSRRAFYLVAVICAALIVSADACSAPSGVDMPTGNVTTAGGNFTPLYSQDFIGSKALGTVGPNEPGWEWYGYNWDASHEFLDPGGNGYYAPLKVASWHDGELDLWFHTDGSNGRHYLATLMSTTNQLYGRFTVRMKADSVMPGYHVTPLLWPQSEVWPRDGEVDFPDVWLDSSTAKVSAFMHHQGGTSGGDQDYFDSGSTAYAWQPWAMDWTPSKVIFYKDGVEFGRSTTRIPNTPMHWVLQFDSYPEHPIANATQGHILIDWAVGYSYAP